MDHRDRQRYPTPDDTILCDLCGGAIATGSDYVRIAAESEDGTIVGTLIAHAQCATLLSQEEIAARLGAAVGTDAESMAAHLPLPRCCLCGHAMGARDYVNFIEPLFPGEPGGPLVATTFHADCYRADPDGVQRALDEEVIRQRQRRLDEEGSR